MHASLNVLLYTRTTHDTKQYASSVSLKYGTGAESETHATITLNESQQLYAFFKIIYYNAPTLFTKHFTRKKSSLESIILVVLRAKDILFTKTDHGVVNHFTRSVHFFKD